MIQPVAFTVAVSTLSPFSAYSAYDRHIHTHSRAGKKQGNLRTGSRTLATASAAAAAAAAGALAAQTHSLVDAWLASERKRAAGRPGRKASRQAGMRAS